ncbi:MAG: hypothetical protein OEL57_11610 [Trichlorobacter sp.]|nr:hypothetical protein [Trichlorobacter sp.]MDK9718534.1 hypothetical protein [Trichlorobacter sp.]
MFRPARQWGMKVCVSLADVCQSDTDGDISRVLELHDATFRAGWGECQQ